MSTLEKFLAMKAVTQLVCGTVYKAALYQLIPLYFLIFRFNSYRYEFGIFSFQNPIYHLIYVYQTTPFHYCVQLL